MFFRALAVVTGLSGRGMLGIGGGLFLSFLGIIGVAKAFFNGGEGENGLGREMNCGLGQEPVHAKHLGPNGANYKSCYQQCHHDQSGQQHYSLGGSTRRHYSFLP